MPAFDRSRRLAAAALAAAALGSSSIAHGSGPCPLRLVPPSAPDAWREAATKAALRLAGLDAPHDCRSVEVIVNGDGGATLAFVTTDGRGAARALQAPSDLAPTLEALLVTLPSTKAPSPPEPPSPAPMVAPTAPQIGTLPPPPRPELHMVLGASVGGRLVFVPVAHGSPSLSLRAGVLVDRWELGLVADYAPAYRPFTAAPNGFALMTFSTGLAMGRRETLGGASVGFGAILGVQSMSEEATNIAAITTERSIDIAVPRLTAYGRVSYPERARVRFTTDLGLDAAIGRLRDKATEARMLPALARFGLTLSLGVEASVL